MCDLRLTQVQIYQQHRPVRLPRYTHCQVDCGHSLSTARRRRSDAKNTPVLLVHHLKNLCSQHIEGFRARICIVVRNNPVGFQMRQTEQQLYALSVDPAFTSSVSLKYLLWRRGVEWQADASRIECANSLEGLSNVFHQLSQTGRTA